ncbi:uncharacterized protein Dmoj_GI24785 [Drosophila mojavensis]|uniref:Uncharacterized protein n=1 Tax=Drosophila mojavensis TaxID=7230 RepID=B4K7L9_DROMO|nr:uncharacterized protein Dmoj_GI24785 [Drosophila mojavensis]
MAATFVILLSCLAYGIVASPSQIGSLPGGRPAQSVLGPVANKPSSSYLPPAKQGRRPGAEPLVSIPSNPAQLALGSVVSAPVAQRPVSGRVPVNVGDIRKSSYRPVDPASSTQNPSVQKPSLIGAPRPIVQRPVAPAVQKPSLIGAPRPIVQRPVAPAVQKPSLIGAPRPIVQRPVAPAVPVQRPVSSGSKSGSRTVGPNAPY